MLDPRSGRLITDDLTVTVQAAEGWAAEIFATAAKRLWRWVHLTAFALFFTSGIHAGMAGTDTANLVYRWATVSITAVTMVSILDRVFAGTVRRNAERARQAPRASSATPSEPFSVRIPAATGSQPASGSRQD